MVADGVIVAMSSGAVHGFDAATGHLLWRVGTDQNGPLPFYPAAGQGTLLVVRQPEGSSTVTLTALELGTPPTVVRWAQAFDPARGMPYGTDEASRRRYTGAQLLADTTFAMLQVQTTSEFDARDAIRTLAQEQRTCLIEGCAAPVAVPEELTR